MNALSWHEAGITWVYKDGSCEEDKSIRQWNKRLVKK